MSLTIHKLSTRCRSPRDFEYPAGLVEDVARGPLASELSGQLGPSLDRLPEVIRLKDLRVRLKIPARNLNATSLANAWARAFTIAIHRALAYPAGDGVVSCRHYETNAAYKAAMLRHIATRGLAPSWEFPELKAFRNPSPFDAALEILLDDLVQAPEILAELERQNWLELLLAFWDELSLERIMQAIAGSDGNARGLNLDSLIELGRAAAASGGLRPQWALASRRQAIRLWVRKHQHWPLRAVWHGLRLILRFLEIPALLILRDPELLADAIPFPQWCDSIVINDADSRGIAPGRTLATTHAGLLSVLDSLRPLVPSAATPISDGRSAANVTWIVSDCAGILLMLSIVTRLSLTRFIRKSEFIRFGGMRAFSFLLAGVGMSLLKRWSPSDPVEPAAAIFAGMILDPDLTGMRQFFSSTDAAVMAEFAPGATWLEVFDHAATELSQAFAARVRGFRKASREAVLKQFIRVPGRILVEETRIVVVIDASPWAVALHLSGMDDPIERLEWLGQRRVDFVLEGL